MIIALTEILGPIAPNGVLPPADPDQFPGQESIDSTFSVFMVAFVIVAVVMVVLAIRNAGVYLKRGIDPTTVDAQMKARLLQSSLLDAPSEPAPPGAAAPAERSLEERLAELDRLLAAGTISTAEHATARAEALRSL